MKKIIFLLLLSACSGADKLNKYHKSISEVKELSKVTYFTFTDCKFSSNDNEINIIPGRKDYVEGFYQFSLYDIIRNSWKDEESLAGKSKIASFIYRYDDDYKKGVYDLLFSLGKRDSTSKQRLRLNQPLASQTVIGVYPSLSIKEKRNEATYKSIIDLTEGGQEKYFDLINSKPKQAEELFRPVLTGGNESENDVKDVKIIVTTQNLSLQPSDRITKVRHKIYSRDLIFKEWDNAKLDWATIDLGSLEVTQSNTYSLSGEAGKDSLTKGKASADVKREKTAKVGFTRRYVSLSGSIASNEIVLYQEGVPGIDLSGTISFDAKLKLKKDGYNVTKDFKDEVLIFLYSEYTIRHVSNKRGSKTYIEGDDAAKMITVKIIKPYVYSFFNRQD